MSLWSEANALNTFGWLYVVHDRHEGKTAVFEAAVVAARATDDAVTLSTAEWQLAEHRIAIGNPRAAAELLGRALATMRDVQVLHLVPYVIDSTARLAAELGQGTVATELLAAAERIREVTKVPIWGPARDRRDRLMDRLGKELGDAFEDAWQDGHALRTAGAITAALAATTAAADAPNR